MNNINMTSMLAQLQAMKFQAQGGSEVPREAEGKTDFNALFKASINAVNETQQQAGNLANAFEKGDPSVDLSEVMVALQKANISFQTMTRVRNKLLEAYQDIKNMPM